MSCTPENISRTRRVIAQIALENRYGEDPGGGKQIALFGKMNPVSSSFVRKERPHRRPDLSDGSLAVVPSTYRFDGSLYPTGSGSVGAPPTWLDILQVCGMHVDNRRTASTSIFFTPSFGGGRSATIRTFLDGTRHILSGARGSMSFKFPAGRLFSADFGMTGIYTTPKVLANPTDTVLNINTPEKVCDLGFVVSPYDSNDITPVVKEISIDISSPVIGRLGRSATNSIHAIDRVGISRSRWKMTIENDPVYDYFTAYANQLPFALSMHIGTGIGRQFVFSTLGVKSAIINSEPSYVDTDGIRSMNIDFRLSGKDFLTLEYR